MAEAGLTYGKLDEVLRTHGFVASTIESKARIYKHQTTGAKVILPVSPLAEAVLPHHLIVVRTVLREYGMVEPAALALNVKRVS